MNTYDKALQRIARNVRLLRTRAGWTQEVASGFVDLNARHLQKVETAGVNVTVETLVKIAHGFGLADWSELAGPTEPVGGLMIVGDPAVDGLAEGLRRIARNVLRCRKRAGWTQKVAAGCAGVAPRHWQRIEAGRENTSLEILVRIAVGLRLKDWTELLKTCIPAAERELARRGGA